VNRFAGVLCFNAAHDARELLGGVVRYMGGSCRIAAGTAAPGNWALACDAFEAYRDGPLRSSLLECGRDGVVLAFDGQIDERDELSRLMRMEPGSSALSDAQLVAAAYRRWGEQCPDRLLGDFAFALWDTRSNRLYCARSAMGGSRLNYFAGRDFIAFCSDHEALLALPGVSSAVNEDRLAGLFAAWEFDPADRRSWLRDISGLLAGEYMVSGPDGNMRVDSYYSGTPMQHADYASGDECVQHFAEVFARASRCRIPPGSDPALLLSGGMDSAAVLAMMRRNSPDRLVNAYSVIDADPNVSTESRNIAELASLPGVQPHFFRLPNGNADGAQTDLLDVFWSRSHPMDNSILLIGLMFLLAARNGHRTLQLGISGDVVLDAPLNYIAHVLRRGRLVQGVREARAANANHVFLRGRGTGELLLRNMYAAVAPHRLKQRIAAYRRAAQRPSLARSLINPEFARRIGLEERIAEDRLSNPNPFSRAAEEAQQRNVLLHVANNQSTVAWVSSRYGVVARDPFADRRVVEFFQGLPMEYKVKSGWTKHLVRSAFQDDLPSGFVWRTVKEHLGWKVVHCLVRESLPQIETLLDEDLHRAESYLDIDAVRRLYAETRRSQDYERCVAIYDVATLLSWSRRVQSRL